MQIPFKYTPVCCPQCGEIGPPDKKWTCSCGLYTHYPYNANVENAWQRIAGMIKASGPKMGGGSKSKRHGAKKVEMDLAARYHFE